MNPIIFQANKVVYTVYKTTQIGDEKECEYERVFTERYGLIVSELGGRWSEFCGDISGRRSLSD